MLNHIRGLGSLVMFGLVEEFILPLAVALLTLHIEWFVQAHYVESITPSSIR
jgi:hypothetical protein